MMVIRQYEMSIFTGDRSSLLNRNLLYHPVKVYVPLLARLKRYYARP